MHKIELETIYTLLSVSKKSKPNIQTEIRKLFPLIALIDPQNYSKYYKQLSMLAHQIEYSSPRHEFEQKTVVGIGGGFSAGKSRFINSLLGIDLLPEALEPCTAVATYLSQGIQERTQAVNLFNHLVDIDQEQLAQLRHFVDDKTNQTDSIKLSQILQYTHIITPLLQWKNIALLDTPGYSKADGQHHLRSDEQIALTQLRQADYVVWLVSAKNGTIRNEDLEFLHQLKLKKPLFIVMTQSDLVGRDEVKPIMHGIKAHLDNKNILIAGIMAWAAPISQVYGKHVAGDDILVWLSSIDQPIVNNYQNDLKTLFLSLTESSNKKYDDFLLQINYSSLDNSDINQIISTHVNKKNIFKKKNILLIEKVIWLLIDISVSYFLDFKQAIYYYCLLIENHNLKLNYFIKWMEDNKYNDQYLYYYLGNIYEKGIGNNSQLDLQKAIFIYKNLVSEDYNPALKDLKRLAESKNLLAIKSLAKLSEKKFNHNVQASDYHILAIRYFGDEDSIKWLLEKSISGLSYIKETFKNITNELKIKKLQYYYALYEFDKGSQKSACEYMFLSAQQNYKPAYDWLVYHEDNILEARYKLAYLLEKNSKEEAIYKYKSLIELNLNAALKDLKRLAESKNLLAIKSLAELSEKKFNHNVQASDYHVLAVRYFGDEDSIRWLIKKSISGLVYTQKVLKNIVNELKDSDLQYYYALYEFDKGSQKSACEYMFLSAQQNYKPAYDWLAEHATQTESYAQLKMIKLFDIGKTLKKDQIVVFDYCYLAIKNNKNAYIFNMVHQWAIERKVSLAQYLLATCYSFGYVVKVDYKLAYKFYNLASPEIESAFYNKTVIDYLNYNLKNKAKKREALLIFRDHNNIIFNKANINLNSFFVFKKPKLLDFMHSEANFEIDYSKIYRLFIIIVIISILIILPLFIAMNNPILQNSIGNLLGYTNNAIYWHEKSANHGNEDSQFSLGYRYENGLGVVKDYEVARKWYQLAVNLGNVKARRQLIKMYIRVGNDLITNQDYTAAKLWYQRAADEGSAEALYHLGEIYENGWGVKVDYIVAIKWYTLSMEKGNKNAKNSLINIFLHLGNYNNNKKYYTRAKIWYQRAADEGSAEAQYHLGEIYENGLGVKVDYIIAIKWYLLSIDKGNKKSKMNLLNLYVTLGNYYNNRKNYPSANLWYKRAIDERNVKTRQ